MSRIMNRYPVLTALLAAAALAACDKNSVQTITMPEVPASQIRFFNFGVNAPSVNFYANTTKLTATGSATCSPTPTDTTQARICLETGAEATTGVSYGAGSVASTGMYSAIAPGTYDLKGTIAATTPATSSASPSQMRVGRRFATPFSTSASS